jgi:hypothetical protein
MQGFSKYNISLATALKRILPYLS